MLASAAAVQPIDAMDASPAVNSSGSIPDPFVTARRGPRPDSHRYSSFDLQTFAHSQTSPAQARRALEAHLTETNKRLEEASRLGTTLVQQRTDIEARIKDVERQQGERDLNPELRQKLIEVEKEFHEVGRESARAFLAPKARLGSLENVSNGTLDSESRVQFHST